MVSVYSVKEAKKIDSSRLSTLIAESKLSSEEKKKIIAKVGKMFEQKEYDLFLKWNLSIEKTKMVWQEIAARLMEQREVKNDTVLAFITDSLQHDSAIQSAKRVFESLEIDEKL